MDFKFKPDDFAELDVFSVEISFGEIGGSKLYKYKFAEGIAVIANRKLQEWLDKAPTVLGDERTNEWWGEWIYVKEPTHKAKLVCIEEVK